VAIAIANAKLSPDHDLPTRRILPPAILHAIEQAAVNPSGYYPISNNCFRTRRLADRALKRTFAGYPEILRSGILAWPDLQIVVFPAPRRLVNHTKLVCIKSDECTGCPEVGPVTLQPATAMQRGKPSLKA
jgi:hypothetical protein